LADRKGRNITPAMHKGSSVEEAPAYPGAISGKYGG